MKGDKGRELPLHSPLALAIWLTFLEFAGTLLGFDDYVSKSKCVRNVTGTLLLRNPPDMVLENVTELFVSPNTCCFQQLMLTDRLSDYSGSNTKLPKILLNGNNICMV